MVKQHFPRRAYTRIFVLTMAFLLAGNCLYAWEQADVSEGTRYRIFPLKHISVERGKKYLAEVGIGTVSHITGSSALLVTAQPLELTKARAVLELVDGPEPFVIQVVLPISAVRKMPSNEQIAATVGDVSIGTFSNPPSGETGAKAVIDVHNDAVLAVVPASLLEKIVSAIAQQTKSAAGEQAQDKPQVQDKPEAPAEGKVIEPAEPNEPGPDFAAKDKTKTLPETVAVVPEPKVAEPNEQEQKAPTLPAAVGPYEPGPVPDGDETLELFMPEKLTIVDLLGLVGPYLQLDFIYDEKQVVGEVTINPHGKFRGPVKVENLYPLLESVLKLKGFAMTRGKGNLVTIVPNAEALDIDPALLDDDKGKIEHGDVIVTRVFALKHIDASSATNLLTAMRLSIAPPIAERKTLIVTGYAHRMPRIAQLLEMVDKPGEPKKFRFRQLQYTMAQTLAPKIQTLAEQLGTVSITIGEVPATTAPPVSPQRSGETAAQYQLRLRREAAARSAVRTTPTAPQTITPGESVQPTVYLDADERTNRILMIGLEEQLAVVDELIDTLDVAQQDLRTLQLYKIEHVDAEGVKKKLEELGIIGASQATASARITGGTRAPTTQPPTARPPTTVTQTTAATTEPLVEEPQVVVVEPTNSLLVNATTEQHVQIATIISYVDSETQADEIPYRLYQLKNQSPEHLVEVLEKLIQETVQDKESKVEQVIKKQEEQIIIVPDPNTSSLIVYASKKNQEWLSELIEKLDKRRPQVLIDVTLVQISKTDAFDYDLNIISSFPDLTSTSGLTGALMGGVADGLGGVVDGAGGTNLVSKLTSGGRDRFVDFQAAGGSGTGFYGDKHINALLTAMQQKDYGRILAKPKILVNDNQEGIISTTDKTYVTKTSSIPVTSGAAGQDATLIQTAVDYADYDAGITLTITPHISESDLLRLDIDLVRSDFGTITGEKPPDTTESNIATTVTVPDGSTIILGGLLKLNQSKGGRKVPLLGDIPLLGGFFRSASNSDIQRNLYVFVKAEIIRPVEAGFAQADLERISERNRDAFEEREVEFQEYHDWPGIKPKQMKPIKVLDVQ